MEKLKGINLHVIRSFTELTCQGMGLPLTYTTPAHVTNTHKYLHVFCSSGMPLQDKYETSSDTLNTLTDP